MIIRGESETFLKKFLKAKSENRAFLVIGNKKTASEFAELAARFIFCKSKNNCGECENCTVKINPDFYRYPETNLKIEEAREIVYRASQSPWGNTKLLIINITQASADVQTTLLKTLEDSQGSIFFILTSEATDHLILPLLSRLTILQLLAQRPTEERAGQKLLKKKSLKEKMDGLNSIAKDREASGDLLRAFEFHLEDELFSERADDYSELTDLISYFFEIKKRFIQKTYYNKMLLENLLIADLISK